jgi:hypothetical protein
MLDVQVVEEPRNGGFQRDTGVIGAEGEAPPRIVL